MRSSKTSTASLVLENETAQPVSTLDEVLELMHFYVMRLAPVVHLLAPIEECRSARELVLLPRLASVCVPAVVRCAGRSVHCACKYHIRRIGWDAFAAVV